MEVGSMSIRRALALALAVLLLSTAYVAALAVLVLSFLIGGLGSLGAAVFAIIVAVMLHREVRAMIQAWQR